MLDCEEYVEQSHFFAALAERQQLGASTQDLLASVREEILTTTKLPMAIDYLAGELRLNGAFAPAMRKLEHYFTPFQAFVFAEAERDTGRFDLQMALAILACEARYRAKGATPQGIFLFEFESLARNRLGYERGLDAIAADTVFDDHWREWITLVRRQIGLIDFADLLYVRSAHYARRRAVAAGDTDNAPDTAARLAEQRPPLFGEGEGRIAVANRGKDPFFLFNALHRHLGYPEVPRPPKPDESPQLVPQLMRHVERIEARLKLVEEELKGGIDLTRFYGPGGEGPTPPDGP